VPLRYVHEQQLRPSIDEAGAYYEEETPSRWTIIGEDMAHINVRLTADFAGNLLYYKQPEPLSVSNETNWLTRRYPGLVRVACMMTANEHMKEWQVATGYEGQMMKQIAKAGRNNELSRRGQEIGMES
jgi:hypothetical protein